MKLIKGQSYMLKGQNLAIDYNFPQAVDVNFKINVCYSVLIYEIFSCQTHLMEDINRQGLTQGRIYIPVRRNGFYSFDMTIPETQINVANGGAVIWSQSLKQKHT